MIAVIVLGMGVGLGLVLITREYMPRHAHLQTALANLAPQTPRRDRAREAPAPATTLTDRIGDATQSRLAGLPGLRTPDRDLALLDITPRQYWAEKTLCGLLGLALPTLAGAVLALLDMTLPIAVPAVASLLLAAAMFFLPDLSARTRATAAREQFAAAAVAYLRLVAIRRIGSGGVITSMRDAAAVSGAWMFRRIGSEVALAEMQIRGPWDALDDLGDELDLKELHDVAAITRLARHGGAQIAPSLLARADTLQDRILAREHRSANAASTTMVAPMALLILLFGAIVLFGAAMSLLA